MNQLPFKQHRHAWLALLLVSIPVGCGGGKTSSGSGAGGASGSGAGAETSIGTGGAPGTTDGTAGGSASTGSPSAGSPSAGSPSAGSPSVGAGGGSAGGGTAGSGTVLVPTLTDGQAYCGSELCACNNGEDDDGDGQVDGFDVECVGPYDDDEGAFATGISGDNMDPKWQDCFFDGNSGAGDDGCRYSTKCLTGELDLSDPDCTVTQECIDFCAPRTPNGCDCFGCCEVYDEDNEPHFVYVTGECTDEHLDDPDICIPCTQTTECGNECGECELCPGMTPEDLPAHCTPTGGEGGAGGASSGTPGTPGTPEIPVYTCDNGMVVCSADLPCEAGQFCMNGCCVIMAL